MELHIYLIRSLNKDPQNPEPLQSHLSQSQSAVLLALMFSQVHISEGDVWSCLQDSKGKSTMYFDVGFPYSI